jgi:hypothetical protein
MANLKKPPRQLPYKPVGSLVPLLILIFALLTLITVRQRIFDEVKLFHYVPPSQIAQLASEDTMNSYTKHVFYVNHPVLISTVSAFRAQCPKDETDIVLGCYHIGQNGIFIYDVQSASLDGVQQVTAAHEVLHAIYARLSNPAREQLNHELEQYYKHGLVNSRVAAEIQVYQKTEPGSVYDEMSCTFGTEIANLPPALNNYYKQFFTNRQTIVNYEQEYQSAFTSRQDQVTADDQQILSMDHQITEEQQSLEQQLVQIKAEQTVLQNLLSTNADEYNAQVPGYNASVDSYNNGVNSLSNEVMAYNQLVSSRNAIAGAFDNLIAAINTKTTPQVSQ